MNGAAWTRRGFGSCLLLLVALGRPAASQEHGHILVSPAEVKWSAPRPERAGSRIATLHGNPAEPGPFTMRVMLPPGWTIAPHVHATIEYLTVLSGALYVGTGTRFDADQMKVLPAGGFMVMPANAPHFMLVKEDTTIQVHGVGPFVVTFVDPRDEPGKK